jgi:hypothetical protein
MVERDAMNPRYGVHVCGFEGPEHHLLSDAFASCDPGSTRTTSIIDPELVIDAPVHRG